jgi:HNH endonuclease
MANGRYRHAEGYMRIKVGGKLVLEHRYLVEQEIGRKLDKSEVVHHKNEIRDDNRLENLEILSVSDHAKKHAKDKKLEIVTLECPACSCVFERPAFKARWQDKMGHRQFCSKRCVGTVVRQEQMM